MEQNYCIKCGTKLVKKELEHEGLISFCTSCNEYRFENYNVAVSMIVINKSNDKILLIKQYGKPFYILVAGYVNKGEALEDAVIREVKEEMGLDVLEVKFNKSKFFAPSNTLMCNFIAFVENDLTNTNYEIDDYAFFSKDEALANIKENSLAKEFLEYYLGDN